MFFMNINIARMSVTLVFAHENGTGLDAHLHEPHRGPAPGYASR